MFVQLRRDTVNSIRVEPPDSRIVEEMSAVLDGTRITHKLHTDARIRQLLVERLPVALRAWRGGPLFTLPQVMEFPTGIILF